MKYALFLFAVIASFVLGASPAADRCAAALRRALNAQADWTMERRLAPEGHPLVSDGNVSCVARSGIVWRVTHPFVSSVVMTTNAMAFADEDGERVKSLDQLPHYADIRRKTDAFVAGDAAAFDGLFALTVEALPANGWRLVLKPEVSGLDRLFAEIELTGGDLPTNAVLRSAGGGTCRIRFRERPNGR